MITTCIDVWTNISNDAVNSSSIQGGKGGYLMKTTDTGSESRTEDHLVTKMLFNQHKTNTNALWL